MITDRPAKVLVAALRHLGQEVDAEMESANCGEVLDVAARRWDLARVPRTAAPTMHPDTTHGS
jgi:hypothetical protein